jgi:hypothetical protein
MRIGGEAAASGSATATGVSDDATAAEGGRRIRRIGGVRSSEQPPAPIGPLVQELDHERRFSGRMLPLVIGVVAIIVIVAGVIVILNRNSGTTTGQVAHNNTPPGGSAKRHHGTNVPFTPSGVRVAVLNGTAQQGLAGDVANKLARSGYRRGNVTNAASQTEARTFVYYMSGAALSSNRIAAQHVARALALPASRVRRAGSSAIQSCSINASGASLGKCAANVIVSVGQDRASLATGG